MTDSTETIPLIRTRMLLLALAGGAVAIQVVLALRRGGDVVISATIIGAISLVALVIALVLRSVAGRVEKRVHELRAQHRHAVVVVHHPALQAWASRRDHVVSLGTYPTAVLEEGGLRLLGEDSDRGPLLEWGEIQAVTVTELAERFFVRRAIELRTGTESVVLAPYGKRALVGFHAGTEADFSSLAAALSASAVRADLE